MSDKALTPKQEAFCISYIDTGNASEAYRLTYGASKMKPETINRAAKELIDNPKIAARVNSLKNAHLQRHNVTVDRVIAEFAKLAFLDIRKIFDDEGRLKSIHDIDDETAAAISGIEVESLFEGRGDAREMIGRLHKLKLTDKKGALDSLAKYLGMFVEKTEISGSIVLQTKEQRDAAVAAALAADT